MFLFSKFWQKSVTVEKYLILVAQDFDENWNWQSAAVLQAVTVNNCSVVSECCLVIFHDFC